ncbi:MAG: MarR family transcriptional regulator [Rhizobacter sp.]|nr:MarR family transcriptional regulator [Rhizobacter sp.]
MHASHGLPDTHDSRIGYEGRAADDDHLDTRVWLRLLACTTQIEQEIRTRLRKRFGTTLPRFDYLAQLDRHPQGLRMNTLSSYMMVSGGNVTGLTDQLVADGWVERSDDPDDGRSFRVRLTRLGRSRFAAMAREHEAWLAELFKGLGLAHKEALYAELGRLRALLLDPARGDASPPTPVGAKRRAR